MLMMFRRSLGSRIGRLSAALLLLRDAGISAIVVANVAIIHASALPF